PPLPGTMQPTIAVDIGAFAGLFVLSSLIRRRFKHRGYSATGAGGIVMSTGVFTAFAFTQLPMYTPLLGRLATIEIFVIWLFLAWSFGSSFVNRHFRMHYAHPLRRFAMGTWVAGTAVLATLATRSMPEAIWFSRVLALVAVAIYLPYVVLFVQGYAQLWRHPLQQRANGVILLATVSTQSIVLALHANFGGSFPVGIEIGLGRLCGLCASRTHRLASGRPFCLGRFVRRVAGSRLRRSVRRVCDLLAATPCGLTRDATTTAASRLLRAHFSSPDPGPMTLHSLTSQSPPSFVRSSCMRRR
ncbi:MAG: hypothetical protein L0K86_15335, partial [Actinomycetia bacterium]|nr:hypothetical protein [Actinomycetes bacterium]